MVIECFSFGDRHNGCALIEKGGEGIAFIQYPQEKCVTEIVEEIRTLEKMAWPSCEDDEGLPSASNTYVTSFVLMEKILLFVM